MSKTRNRGMTQQVWRWLRPQPARTFHIREAALAVGAADDKQVSSALSYMLSKNRDNPEARPYPGVSSVPGHKGVFAWDGGASAKAPASRTEADRLAEAGLVELGTLDFGPLDPLRVRVQFNRHPEHMETLRAVKGPSTRGIGNRHGGVWWVDPAKARLFPCFGSASIATFLGIPNAVVTAAMNSGELLTTDLSGGRSSSPKRTSSAADVLDWVDRSMARVVEQPTSEPLMSSGHDPFTGLTPTEAQPETLAHAEERWAREDEAAAEADRLQLDELTPALEQAAAMMPDLEAQADAYWNGVAAAATPAPVEAAAPEGIAVGDVAEVIAVGDELIVLQTAAGRLIIGRPARGWVTS